MNASVSLPVMTPEQLLAQHVMPMLANKLREAGTHGIEAKIVSGDIYVTGHGLNTWGVNAAMERIACEHGISYSLDNDFFHFLIVDEQPKLPAEAVREKVQTMLEELHGTTWGFNGTRLELMVCVSRPHGRLSSDLINGLCDMAQKLRMPCDVDSNRVRIYIEPA